VTGLIKAPFIEVTAMVKFADAPGGINCGPVLDATAKSAADVTT
jgi:hypothetical protein